MRMNSPCYNCEDRHENCHADCTKYNVWLANYHTKKDSENKNKSEYVTGNDIQIASVERATHKKARRG